LLLNGPSFTKVPEGLNRYPVFPISRLEEVIQAIHSGFEPLTEDEGGVLANVYTKLRTPADQLSQSPKALKYLAGSFNRITGNQFSEERLLSEIFRMRKKGQLPRLPTPPRTKPSLFLKGKRRRPARLRIPGSVSG
jgi:hypothetical protein